MITNKENVFHLDTKSTSYIFMVMPTGQLQNLYYGKKIRACEDYSALKEKYSLGYGGTVAYTQKDTSLNLENICLEYSSFSNGDYRQSPLQMTMPDGSNSCDFVYKAFEIIDGVVPVIGMPYAVGKKDEIKTLKIELSDTYYDIRMVLYYTCFYNSDVIVRKTEIVNNTASGIKINKIMSLSLDLPQSDYTLLTFDGTWIHERYKHEKKLSNGLFVNTVTTGTSSNKHNPCIVFRRNSADEFQGECIGVNLIYSGNHYEAADVSYFGKLRIMAGINPETFEWKLEAGQAFTTPEAVLSFSNDGLNGLSGNMHKFIQNHIVRGYWAKKERPVLINNWEATYFDFSESKVLKLAEEAAKLGIELFILDDGWFGKRDDDTSSLGDWFEYKDKLPNGLKGLADRINDLGMMFGLWFEPEMVNENSELYRKHPEWAVKIPGRKQSLGRNQMVLDYANKDVRDYIVDVVSNILNSANIQYVKWDMNRQLSDAYSNTLEADRQGEFYHRYVLGLYDVLGRICSKFPEILFESCSSGGNRFDLGMLCYMPQTWTSDNTDAISRLQIQSGTSYGYPLSTMGAHVSASPNHQTLRATPIETRFNVAAFGVLGYELDLTELSQAEKKAVKAQIEYYKEHRKLFQYGRFFRLEPAEENISKWIVVSEDGSEAVLGMYQKLAQPNPVPDIIKTKYLDNDALFQICSRKQFLSIEAFGNLVNEVTTLPIKEDGVDHTITGNHVMLETEKEEYNVYGDHANNAGIKISQQFSGTGYDERIRLMGDYGSRLYYFSKK